MNTTPNLKQKKLQDDLEILLARLYFRATHGGSAQHSGLRVCAVVLERSQTNECRLEVVILCSQADAALLEGLRLCLTWRHGKEVRYQVAFTDHRGMAEFEDVPGQAECWLRLQTATFDEIIESLANTAHFEPAAEIGVKESPETPDPGLFLAAEARAELPSTRHFRAPQRAVNPFRFITPRKRPTAKPGKDLSAIDETHERSLKASEPVELALAAAPAEATAGAPVESIDEASEGKHCIIATISASGITTCQLTLETTEPSLANAVVHCQVGMWRQTVNLTYHSDRWRAVLELPMAFEVVKAAQRQYAIEDPNLQK